MQTQPIPDRIAILGDGQMGLTCAAILRERLPRAQVAVWGHEPGEVEALAHQRTSPRMPGVHLDEGVVCTPDIDAALTGAGLVLNAVPVQFIRRVWSAAGEHLEPGAPVVSVAKGIEVETLLRPTEVVLDAIGELTGGARSVCALSGPTIAGELAARKPATMVAASEDEPLAQLVQHIFSTPYLRIYTSEDIVGVELAGAIKNVIAIAAGIIDGLGLGYNAKSALLARGLAEIVRFGEALGAKQETFFGLAGVGDLATTCFCPEGRNRSCGEAIGKGESLDGYLARTTSVVEGASSVEAVVRIAEDRGVDMPIARAVHEVLYEGLSPTQAIHQLMSRELKAERVG